MNFNFSSAITNTIILGNPDSKAQDLATYFYKIQTKRKVVFSVQMKNQPF